MNYDKHPLTVLRRKAGLAPMLRPTSAAELRKRNPELAAKWAKFISENMPALVAGVTASLDCNDRHL